MAMSEKRIWGLGCFAEQPALQRILDRYFKAYSLGEWRDAFDKDEKGSVNAPALNRLVSECHAMNPAGSQAAPDEKIAGFFLGFENQRLNLSVFTRSRGRQYQKYTASLEELNRLRQKRLH